MGGYPAKKDDISIVLCGEAGQGIQTVEFMLTRFLKQCGYHFFATKEYMSRVRGGSNTTAIRVASRRVRALVDRIDILIPLTRASMIRLSERITDETIIIGNCEKVCGDGGGVSEHIIDIRFETLAKEIGGTIYANTIAVGVISGILALETHIIEEYVRRYFSRKGEEVIGNNLAALRKGYEIGAGLVRDGTVSVTLAKNPDVLNETFLNGSESVGAGALSGGCRFISSYPMTPGTGVLAFLSKWQERFGVIAEQAEDEIAAINMALGASYAGLRSMVTTSGGGFALMGEGVSLAGMLEQPMVIHLAQRPGPATGLPTRTEQADLELVLYVGHGEFPRAIFAPGSMEEAFRLTRHAFNLAAKYQSPVFVLTDQYLIDSYYNLPVPDVGGFSVEPHIVETGEDYRRYRLTEDGISPRGIPGHGQGLVVVDSDEHDTQGHITEDLDLRVKMVDKRLAKLDGLVSEALPPERIGPADATTCILCWGSTKYIVQEAVKRIGNPGVALVHFSQLYPLHPETAALVEKAGRLILIEGNATGQFEKLLRLALGIEVDELILKYSGLQYSVEEVEGLLAEVLGEG